MIGGASIAIALPYAFTAKLITPRCPCDTAEVNAFDRGAIGNHSAPRSDGPMIGWAGRF
ncbi:MAG TPA: hypothetical protein VKB87_04285 [Myxococcaceae bacterium]|nr:hypothetical protein [Myxococcaceae bacterium]